MGVVCVGVCGCVWVFSLVSLCLSKSVCGLFYMCSINSAYKVWWYTVCAVCVCLCLVKVNMHVLAVISIILDTNLNAVSYTLSLFCQPANMEQ